MRVSRGLIGSLGAGVSLAVAGSLALLIVSAVVAFQGWPGVGRGADGPAVTLPSSTARRSAASTVPSHIVLGGGTPAATGRVGGGRGPRRGGPVRGTAQQTAAQHSPGIAIAGGSKDQGGALAATDGASGSSSSPPSPGVPVDGVTGPPGAAGPDAGDAVQQVTGSTGAAIQQTASGAGDAVRPASPEAAGAVEQGGDAASGLVQGAGDGLGGLLGGH